MVSDIKAKYITGTGDVGVGPARIRGIHIASGAGVGRLTITDGSGGSTTFDAGFVASDNSHISIPGAGIACKTGIQVTALTNITSITILYS